MSYENIASITVSTPTNVVTFSSIPQTFTDLILIIAPFKSSTSNGDNIRLRFNADTSVTYLSATNFAVGGSSGYTQNYNNTLGIQLWETNFAMTNFTTDGTLIEATINNYSSTNRNKIMHTQYGSNGNSVPGVLHQAALWPSTAAINRIDLIYSGNDSNINYAGGSTFNLYGVRS